MGRGLQPHLQFAELAAGFRRNLAVFGRDVGYGFGWRLLAGSITPVLSDPYTVSYYLYTDSTGGEYRLDQNSGNVWSSKESVYVSFDANTNNLYFRDGSFWNFGCISATTEADSGVMYPTLMEDTNGNQILIRYLQAPGAGWQNSSARISQIEDVRATNHSGVYYTYSFNYNSDTPKHLTSISNSISTGENYGFSYVDVQTLTSPFNGQSYGTTRTLYTATATNVGTFHRFTYDTSGELTNILLPYKGYFAYDYSTITFQDGHSYRELLHRYLSKDGSTQTTYSIYHESPPAQSFHTNTAIYDPGGVGEKAWYFVSADAVLGGGPGVVSGGPQSAGPHPDGQLPIQLDPRQRGKQLHLFHLNHGRSGAILRRFEANRSDRGHPR